MTPTYAVGYVSGEELWTRGTWIVLFFFVLNVYFERQQEQGEGQREREAEGTRERESQAWNLMWDLIS